MRDTQRSKRVLLAVRPKDREVVCAVLGDEFDLSISYTMEQAIGHLKEDVALIVCGVRFNDGRFFELLEAARSNVATCSVPYFLIVGDDLNYSPAILEGIKQAAFVKGVTGVIELSKLTSHSGKELAYERIRERVRNYLVSTPESENMGSITSKSRTSSEGPSSDH